MAAPSPVRRRQDIQTLMTSDEGREVIAKYAEGVRRMRALDPDDERALPTDPRSWRYQAAIHGHLDVPEEDAFTDPRLWTNCRHGSWFFLPWHRLYLYYFERIIQELIEDPEWSLPYWDYSKTDDESARVLPAPFRSPADEEANPLFTRRRHPRVNDEADPFPLLEDRTEATTALGISSFAGFQEPDEPPLHFGGGESDRVRPNHDVVGVLEIVPHGFVHGGVGGEDPPGLMSRFHTAALDPIFWLHHCNLDRLWDVWIQRYGQESLPQSEAWLGTTFKFFDADKSLVENLTVGDILVSADLGYTYESTDPPAGMPPAQPPPAGAFGEEAAVGKPQLVGATEGVPMSSRADVPIDIEAPPAGAFGEGADGPQRWYVRVEDLTGLDPRASAYDVYVNLPEDGDPREHPQHRVGAIPSFGIPEMTAGKTSVGRTVVFEITDALTLVGGGGPVVITLVPTDVTGEACDGGDVHAGRVSIYAG